MSWLEECVLHERIGKGSFGNVFRGELPASLAGSSCAVKVVHTETESERRSVLREVALLRRAAAHPNFVHYIGMSHVEASRSVHVFLELCVCSLSDLIRQRGAPLPDVVVLAAAYSIADALAYLHTELNAVHRDVKGANVLLSPTGQLKLSDFNVSAQLSPTRTSCKAAIGTPQYMAPEVIVSEEYGASADMWSLGVTVLELAEGKVPNAQLESMAAMFRVVVSPAPQLTQPSEHSAELRALVGGLLVKEATARFTAPHLLAHACVRPVAPADVRAWVLCQLAWEQQTRRLALAAAVGGALPQQSSNKRALKELPPQVVPQPQISGSASETNESKRLRTGLARSRCAAGRQVAFDFALPSSAKPPRHPNTIGLARKSSNANVYQPSWHRGLTVSSDWDSTAYGSSLSSSTGGFSTCGMPNGLEQLCVRTVANSHGQAAPIHGWRAVGAAALVSARHMTQATDVEMSAPARACEQGSEGKLSARNTMPLSQHTRINTVPATAARFEDQLWCHDAFDLDVLMESTISGCTALGR